MNALRRGAVLTLFAVFALFVQALPVLAQTLTPSLALSQLIDSEWERGLRESPETASYQGDTRYNDRWSDLSLPAIKASQTADADALKRLLAIDRAALTTAEQLNYDTLAWQLKLAVERQRFSEHLMPMHHQGGVQTADNIVQALRFRSSKDYRDYLARLAALPKQIDQVIALMQAGVKAGRVPPRVLMERVPAQIRAQVVDDVTTSPFYAPFNKWPDALATAERAALTAQASTTLRDQVVPAYRRLLAAFTSDYLPHTRSSIGVSAMPDGKAYYDMLARSYTTTELSAAAIHAVGLQEVARLSKAMLAAKEAAGFRGSMAEFFEFLRTDARFFAKTPAELLAAYQAVTKRIDPELVKVSRVIPRMPYGVRAIPANIAPDTTTAYYQQPAGDGSRAGFYFVNLHKPETRPTWEMMALSLHEAVPGHHFQFARALELESLPMFRRTAYFVAYSEGWALYAEQLGYDMGLYDDPYERFGQLTYEMWRAVRLVVDTGIHTMGWSREQAITYFKANSAKTEHDIVNEVDRYIGTPGQALAYKIGQIKISELRAFAQAELGERFDLRDFNDTVLATGSVPLAALELRIKAWVKSLKPN
jgi:uncharacterized protein (DUF885 family)